MIPDGNWLHRRLGTNEPALFAVSDGEEQAGPAAMRAQRTCVGQLNQCRVAQECEGHAGRGGVISPRSHGLEMVDGTELYVAIELLISDFYLVTANLGRAKTARLGMKRLLQLHRTRTTWACSPRGAIRLKHLHGTGHPVNP